MTTIDKKKKAAIMAVAYYLKQEEYANKQLKKTNNWIKEAKKVSMNNRILIQRHGRLF